MKFRSFSDLIAEHKQVMEQLSTAEQQMRPLRIQITSLKSERDELEKQYRLLNEQHSQCRLRETLHLTKVHESVHLAEMAIKERDEAVEREKEIRGELQFIADVEEIDEKFFISQRNVIVWQQQLAV